MTVCMNYTDGSHHRMNRAHFILVLIAIRKHPSSQLLCAKYVRLVALETANSKVPNNAASIYRL